MSGSTRSRECYDGPRMTLGYDDFRAHQERYEREKADKEDAEKWRQEQARRKESREQPKEEPKPDAHTFE